MTTRCGDHPAHAALNCPECALEVVTDPDAIAARAALVRAAIPRRTPAHKHPEPPVTDVRAAREAIDAKEQP